MNTISHWAISFTLAVLLILPMLVTAQDSATQEYVPYRQNAISHISSLNSGDQAILQAKRAQVDDIAQRELGRSLDGIVAHDLSVLQDLLDRKIVTPDQRLTLQAMGVVLGDLYVRQGTFHWVSYTDDLGKSLAVQIGKTGEVLFPVTMISRLVEAGIDIDVEHIYEHGLNTARAMAEEDDLETVD